MRCDWEKFRQASGRWILFAATVIIVWPAQAVTRADAPLEYNRDIRPILADACFSCHGPDSGSRKADLRLDEREAAVEMSAILPGDAALSEMMRRILSEDPDEIMPPPETKKTLTDEQKALLTRWINEGAEYQLHWSFIPPQKPSPPMVGNEDWISNPIDRFVLSRLESLQLAPAPRADRRTLARRLSLDLRGLPPEPELVEQFVADDAPNAYEKLVDKLLDSSEWGEHRARYWLDAARYADTHGFHFDNFREAWAYRDWVINAFNSNMPFDQFTIENLAGDLLPEATLDQRIASGFNRCNMTTNEGGVIPEEYLVLYTRDRTETSSQVWLGLTAGCAVCHSHKFDPLSQQEFYSLAAFFNNTTQNAMDGNIKDTPPVIVVPRLEDRPRWEELTAELAAVRQTAEERREAARSEFENWLASATNADFPQELPVSGRILHFPLENPDSQTAVFVDGQRRELPVHESASWDEQGQTGQQALKTGNGPALELADAGDFEWDQPFSCAAWVKLGADDNGPILARMQDGIGDFRGWDFYLDRRRVGAHLISRWNFDAIKVISKAQIPKDKWTHVAFSYDGSRKASGITLYINGEPQEKNVQFDRLQGNTIRTPVPLKVGQRDKSDPLTDASLNNIEVFSRVISEEEAAAWGRSRKLARFAAKPAEERKEAETAALYEFWLTILDPAYTGIRARIATLEREEETLRDLGTIAHVMQEKGETAMAFVLNRGEYDKREEQVTPDTPAVLPDFPDEFPRNRLGFAQWLLLPEHPLTARVTVNRFWQEIFGTGIVKTAGDFGVMGELPAHPELLDWLACEFRDQGWDVKKLYKLIVMSSTYQQAAIATPEKIERDPENRLLTRGPRFRMDAEMVRDYALAASGSLVPILGGPSVKPYQPPGVWEAIAMNVSNTANYEQGNGTDLYRRSLYTFVKRMAPPASLEIFNAPNRELCTVRRERTNTPLQALVTLNDEQFVEAARKLAEWTLHEGGSSFESRLSFITQRLLSRDLKPTELQIVQKSFDCLSQEYQQNPAAAEELIQVGESQPDATLDPGELAAWTMLCNQLMNLDEVLTK